MNHEILFRGKRVDNGEWVEGHLLEGNDDLCAGSSFICPHVYSARAEGESLLFGGFIEVDPATVGQYTGLTDKNGRKIFEGDVVKGLFDYKCMIGHITYGSNATFYIERDGLSGIYLDNAAYWLSVIGNIRDNPELVGGESR